VVRVNEDTLQRFHNEIVESCHNGGKNVAPCCLYCRTVMMIGCYRLLAAGSVNALRVACCCRPYSELAPRPRTTSREQLFSTQGFRRVLPVLNISATLTAGKKLCNYFSATPNSSGPLGRLGKFSSSTHSNIDKLGAVCGGSNCD